MHSTGRRRKSLNRIPRSRLSPSSASTSDPAARQTGRGFAVRDERLGADGPNLAHAASDRSAATPDPLPEGIMTSHPDNAQLSLLKIPKALKTLESYPRLPQCRRHERPFLCTLYHASGHTANCPGSVHALHRAPQPLKWLFFTPDSDQKFSMPSPAIASFRLGSSRANSSLLVPR